MEKEFDIVVSKMTAKDVPFVALIEKECFSTPWSENSLLESLETEGSLFLCARLNGNIIGYIGATIVLDEAYVSNIAVTENMRRMGAATQLLCECESICREKGCAFLTLEVRKSNSGAVALYQKKGFHIVGERKNFYSDPCENALLMTKYF